MTKRAAKFAEMEDDYLFCRAWRHKWDPEEAVILRGTGLIEVMFQCERCPTRRRDRIGRFEGTLDSRAYEHPDNYLVEDVPSWGGRQTFNNNVRLQAVKRLMGSRR